MAGRIHEEIATELKRGGQLSEHLKDELNKSMAPGRCTRAKERMSLLRSRFTRVDGKPGIQPRWPALFRYGNLRGRPRLPHIFPLSPPPPLSCAGGFTNLRSQSLGYSFGSDDLQPRLGPLVNPAPTWGPDVAAMGFPYHIYSVLTRPNTGELSIAAATANSALTPGYPAQEQLFFGAEGLDVAASMSQGWFIPDLPKRGINLLYGSAQLVADHVMEALTVIADSDQTAAAIYGIVTVTVSSGLFQSIAQASSSGEFLKFERSNGENPSTNFSFLDNGGVFELGTVLKYDGTSPVVVVEVEVALVCAVMFGAKYAEGALADLRFGDDDRLWIVPDGISSAIPNPPSCPFQVSQIQLCAA